MSTNHESSNTTTFDFTYDQLSQPFAVPLKEHLGNNHDADYTHIVVGALVLDATTDPSTPRVLLVQRSASDSLPNCWEVPGGLCDDEDLSILHAVARELQEEAGVRATHIGPPVGEPHFFSFGSGTKVCKMVFVTRVEMNGDERLEPVLNPEEHQRFVWASESEVKEGKVGDVDLKFTNRALQNTILVAFRGLEIG